MLDTTLTDQTQAFLDAFGTALEQEDIDAATEMFQDDCYWRDLVSFTWNIKTVEGKDQVADMLRHQLATTKPTGWKVAEGETPTEDGGVTTAWIEFETAVARGYGLVRLKDGRIWTLLTTMVELKGHEEPKGFQRPLGAKHGAGKHRTTWKEEREREEAELGYTTQPYCLIIGGGQGGIALGCQVASAWRANDHRREATNVRATAGASATNPSACMTRSGTTTCPTSSFRKTGRSFRRRTRSATGWRCTPRSWSSTTGPGPRPSPPAMTRRPGNGPWSWTATAKRWS